MSSKQHKVLIVDDEPDLLSSMRRALKKESYETLTAGNGPDALKAMKGSEISMVIADYMMPGMNGIQLLKEIRITYPYVLTIMMTALPDVEIAMSAINEAGIYKFILKPIEINSLKITVRRALESLDMEQDLLQKIKGQDTILQEIEKRFPGITHFQLESGEYVLPD